MNDLLEPLNLAEGIKTEILEMSAKHHVDLNTVNVMRSGVVFIGERRTGLLLRVTPCAVHFHPVHPYKY